MRSFVFVKNIPSANPSAKRYVLLNEYFIGFIQIVNRPTQSNRYNLCEVRFSSSVYEKTNTIINDFVGHIYHNIHINQSAVYEYQTNGAYINKNQKGGSNEKLFTRVPYVGTEYMELLEKWLYEAWSETIKTFNVVNLDPKTISPSIKVKYFNRASRPVSDEEITAERNRMKEKIEKRFMQQCHNLQFKVRGGMTPKLYLGKVIKDIAVYETFIEKRKSCTLFMEDGSTYTTDRVETIDYILG